MFSLLPLATFSIVEATGFWRGALAAYALAHAVDVSSFLFRQPEKVRGAAWLGLAFALSQLLVAVLLTDSAAEAMYMVSVMWHLGGAAMGFVFLIWSRRADPNEADM